MTIPIARGIDVMDPAAGTEANHHYIRPLFGYLVAGGGNKIEPGIAKSWEMDPDGKGWTFTIREVSAHNGETVDVDDVYWDRQRLRGQRRAVHLPARRLILLDILPRLLGY